MKLIVVFLYFDFLVTAAIARDESTESLRAKARGHLGGGFGLLSSELHVGFYGSPSWMIEGAVGASPPVVFDRYEHYVSLRSKSYLGNSFYLAPAMSHVAATDPDLDSSGEERKMYPNALCAEFGFGNQWLFLSANFYIDAEWFAMRACTASLYTIPRALRITIGRYF